MLQDRLKAVFVVEDGSEAHDAHVDVVFVSEDLAVFEDSFCRKTKNFCIRKSALSLYAPPHSFPGTFLFSVGQNVLLTTDS